MKNEQIFRKGLLVALFKLFNEIPLKKKSASNAKNMLHKGLYYADLIDAEITHQGHISRLTYIAVEDFIVALDKFGCKLLNSHIEPRWADVIYRSQHELEEVLENNSFLFMWWDSSNEQKKRPSIQDGFDLDLI